MQVICPHCQDPIEILGEAWEEAITCPSCDGAFNLVSADADEQPGQTIGGYRLIERLGAGGSGTVWKAQHGLVDRDVAVKFLHPHLARQPTAAERFFRQAKLVALLCHSAIIPVYECGWKDGRFYIIMRFVDGPSLSDLLRGRQLTFREAAEFCAKIAAALEFAHQAGVVHGNLTPSNIIIDAEGEPHITDFGLARREADEVALTDEGPILGTLAYMSPEQVKSEGYDADAHSNVYSLGVILFELLTGERPFRGTTMVLFKQILNDDPPSPRRINAGVPEDLESICLKCLEKEPLRRYQTAQEVADELWSYLTSVSMASSSIGSFAQSADSVDFREELSTVPDSGDSAPVLDSAPFVTLSEPADSQSKPYLDENVQFTAYWPRQVTPEKYYTVLAFAHCEELPPDAADEETDPAGQVQRQAQEILGGKLSDYRSASQESAQAIPREGELTFALEIDGFRCNPPRQTIYWEEPVHRVEFRIKSLASSDGTTCRGRLSVFLGDILLADVNLRIQIKSTLAETRQAPAQRTDARSYRKIFASYSRKDLSIVEQFERYATAMGDRYLRDLVELRSGELWNDGLKRMIEDADVFQLFWSANSMDSPIVRQEWEYALSLGRANFIRPTYWEQPFPENPPHLPPERLRELHFQLLGRFQTGEEDTPDSEAAHSEEDTDFRLDSGLDDTDVLMFDDDDDDEASFVVPLLSDDDDDDDEISLEARSGTDDPSVTMFDEDDDIDFADQASSVVKPYGDDSADLLGEDDELDDSDVFDAADEDFDAAFELGESRPRASGVPSAMTIKDLQFTRKKILLFVLCAVVLLGGLFAVAYFLSR